MHRRNLLGESDERMPDDGSSTDTEEGLGDIERERTEPGTYRERWEKRRGEGSIRSILQRWGTWHITIKPRSRSSCMDPHSYGRVAQVVGRAEEERLELRDDGEFRQRVDEGDQRDTSGVRTYLSRVRRSG